MIYANGSHIQNVGINWNETIQVIEDAVYCLTENDFAQPKKPYLRYRNQENRIIAMPAFLGGRFNKAGIKWISSFPKNIEKDIPRAHSVIVLNDAETGKPEMIFNSPLLSIIRTASVSGMVAKKYLEKRKNEKINIGIIGFGPIGVHHYKLFSELFKNDIEKIYLYDVKGIKKEKYPFLDNKVEIVNTWQEAYRNLDIVITCTVSKAPYIDEKPKAGSLLLNVSLRDYKEDVYEYIKSAVIVDDWDEVCREDTDIERFYLNKGLIKEQAYTIVDVVCNNLLEKIDAKLPIMFNPMGMGIFDIGIATYFFQKIKEKEFGITLDD